MFTQVIKDVMLLSLLWNCWQHWAFRVLRSTLFIKEHLMSNFRSVYDKKTDVNENQKKGWGRIYR